MKSYDTFIIAFFIFWGIPLGVFRSRFRKKIYQTNSWIINIKPVFIKELQGLFLNLYPNDASYIRLRNFYRTYLAVYTILFAYIFLLS